jgi:hypothetical protein
VGIFASSSVSGAPPAGDRATEVVTGSFTSSTTSPFWAFYGYFNVTLGGTFSATTVLQKSFDGGSTWVTAAYPQTNVLVSFTAPIGIILFEPERGVLYQLSCTYTSGTVNWRMSANGRMAMTEAF